MDAAISAAVSAPYSVFDVAGTRVADGTVSGSPVALPPGTYRVVVRAQPEETFDAVVVDAGGTVRLTLPVRTIAAAAG